MRLSRWMPLLMLPPSLQRRHSGGASVCGELLAPLPFFSRLGDSGVKAKTSAIGEIARNHSRAGGGRIRWPRRSGCGTRAVTKYRLDHTQGFAQVLWTFSKDAE